jgi:predicted nucleotidyltransferase
MQNLFSSSAKPRFADRREILAIARQTALRIAQDHPDVLKIMLFGSFAREDYGARSDLDLLIVLEHSDQPPHERLTGFLRCASKYPTDMLVLTQTQLEARLADGDLFLRRAISEGILLYPESDETDARGYGFYSSLGGQPPFGRTLLEEDR